MPQNNQKSSPAQAYNYETAQRLFKDKRSMDGTYNPKIFPYSEKIISS